MAIQNRRGIYSSGFDTTKLVPGEFAVVQSGDPDGDNGYSLYLCFTSGNVQRIALSEEISSGGSNVTWTPSITTGEQIGVLTINGTAYNILAPKGGSSDNITNDSNVSGTTVSDALNTVSDQIANLEGGAPTQAQTVAQMVDTSKVYLYTGSEEGYIFGAWYHYDGTDWVYGGMYGEAASMSAGVKAALLACFRNVAWIGDDGQDYYDALYNELYPPASLVSITATYTQSGTVYDTASLDDLKPDLVVTANYSDGTSETVTNYTLSGTLADGTSTITVSYGGKSATFSVIVTAVLYPLSDGAHTFETGEYAGRTVTITNQKHVAYHNPNPQTSSTYNGSYAIIKTLTDNGQSADTANINAPTTTLFTLPSGANVVFKIGNIVYSGIGSSSAAKKFAIALRAGTSSKVSTGDLDETTTEKTVTQTMSASANITCLFFYASYGVEDLEFDVELTVNGERWI